MDELKAIGEACGFANVRTFIDGGNLLFATDARSRVQRRGRGSGSRPFSASRCRSSCAARGDGRRWPSANPFGDDKPSRVMAHFIAEAGRR